MVLVSTRGFVAACNDSVTCTRQICIGPRPDPDAEKYGAVGSRWTRRMRRGPEKAAFQIGVSPDALSASSRESGSGLEEVRDVDDQDSAAPPVWLGSIFDRIVCGVDGTESSRVAVAQAVALARASQNAGARQRCRRGAGRVGGVRVDDADLERQLNRGPTRPSS